MQTTQLKTAHLGQTDLQITRVELSDNDITTIKGVQ